MDKPQEKEQYFLDWMYSMRSMLRKKCSDVEVDIFCYTKYKLYNKIIHRIEINNKVGLKIHMELQRLIDTAIAQNDECNINAVLINSCRALLTNYCNIRDEESCKK